MDDPIVVQSAAPYAVTVERIVTAAKAAGNTVFAVIDQAAAATTVGLAMRPTTLIVFGNPKGGTPLMDAHPLAALDLPLKLIVWEEAGVCVGYRPMTALLRAAGVRADDPHISALNGALAALAAAGAAPVA